MEEGRFRLDDFELYALARQFRRNVYLLIKQLPQEERYCLDPQMRRAVLSITNNIAEGHGRWHHQETMQFCRIARGSTEEVLDDLNVCLDEGYGSPEASMALKEEGYRLIARINGYIAYVQRTRHGRSTT